MSRWRELWLYFWRDLMIARTYRIPFVIDAIQALFGATMFFYAARFVDSPQLRSSLPPGSFSITSEWPWTHLTRA